MGFWRGGFEQPAHAGFGDSVLFRDPADAHAVAAVAQHGLTVEYERWTAEFSPFQPRSSDASAQALDDQRSFQFGESTSPLQSLKGGTKPTTP